MNYNRNMDPKARPTKHDTGEAGGKEQRGPVVRATHGIKALDTNYLDRAYDPEKPFREKATYSPLAQFLISFLAQTKEGKRPDVIESAKIFEVNKYGCYRLRELNTTEDFRKALEESDKGHARVTKLLESGVNLREADKVTDAEIVALRETFDEGDTTDNGTNPFTEYLPMMGGPFSRQLYLFDMLDQHRKAFEAWNHNPLAHQIIKITTHFVLGRGVSWKACHQECQEAFDKWADKNKLNERLEFWSDMLSIFGELIIRKYHNPMTGELFLRWVDPSTVWEIITDLEDIERVIYFHQQFPTQYQVLYSIGAQDPMFRPQDYLSTKYVINQIPAADVIHVKLNCCPNEKRGRSDLFPILGWLKRYKDFQTARVLRAIIQSTFAWKNKLKGSDTDVQAFINSFGTQQPQFGSVWVENESSDLSPMTVDVGSTTGESDAPGIINMIAVGVGIPRQYLGFGDDQTRATAIVASEPGAKKFQSRQLTIGRLLKDVADAWFAAEIKAGRLPVQVPKDDKDLPIVVRWLKGFAAKVPILAGAIKMLLGSIASETLMEEHQARIEFNFPEIAVEDRAAKIKDIAFAASEGVISQQRKATMIAGELGIEDFDYKREKEDIAAEAESDFAAMYQAPEGPGPVPAPEPMAPTGGMSSAEKKSVKLSDRR